MSHSCGHFSPSFDNLFPFKLSFLTFSFPQTPPPPPAPAPPSSLENNLILLSFLTIPFHYLVTGRMSILSQTRCTTFLITVAIKMSFLNCRRGTEHIFRHVADVKKSGSREHLANTTCILM